MAFDPRSFTAFERAAHDRIAEPYAEHFAPLTGLALGALLDAAAIQAGRRVLDIASGPGIAAAAAQARGAAVIGVDVSPGMVALAQRAPVQSIAPSRTRGPAAWHARAGAAPLQPAGEAEALS